MVIVILQALEEGESNTKPQFEHSNVRHWRIHVGRSWCKCAILNWYIYQYFSCSDVCK